MYSFRVFKIKIITKFLYNSLYLAFLYSIYKIFQQFKTETPNKLWFLTIKLSILVHESHLYTHEGIKNIYIDTYTRSLWSVILCTPF